MISGREEVEATVRAFVADFLDDAYERNPEGVKLGTFGIAFEFELPAEQEGGIPFTEVAFTCSDHRQWVQAGLFRRAMLLAERGLDEDD